MSQTQAIIKVSDQFKNAVPQEPQPNDNLAKLTALAVVPAEQRDQQLSCQNLLVGKTRQKAEAEAQDLLLKMLANTQVFSEYGKTALADLNELNEKMFNERRAVEIPELQEAMETLNENMRRIGGKYDPNNQRVRKQYQNLKGNLLVKWGWMKSFMERFVEDISSMQDQFDSITTLLEGKQYELLKNVLYYDLFYTRNEEEVDKLIYVIGVMEIIRDLALQKASEIPVGNTSMGDRGGEKRAQIAEFITLLENKIIAYKGRLWVAWAMAPQIRTMRAMSVGISARIDQTVAITIPTMINVINVWFNLTQAERAAQFNEAVEQAYNNVMQMFAAATKATVPMLANALAVPALDPNTVKLWSESIDEQARGMEKAISTARSKRAELESAMMEGKRVIDAATERVNAAQIEQILKVANRDQESEQDTLEIAHTVSA